MRSTILPARRSNSKGVGTVLESLNVVGTAVQVAADSKLALVSKISNVLEDVCAEG
jgi:hypothetical protein